MNDAAASGSRPGAARGATGCARARWPARRAALAAALAWRGPGTSRSRSRGRPGARAGRRPALRTRWRGRRDRPASRWPARAPRGRRCALVLAGRGRPGSGSPRSTLRPAGFATATTSLRGHPAHARRGRAPSARRPRSESRGGRLDGARLLAARRVGRRSRLGADRRRARAARAPARLRPGAEPRRGPLARSAASTTPHTCAGAASRASCSSSAPGRPGAGAAASPACSTGCASGPSGRSPPGCRRARPRLLRGMVLGRGRADRRGRRATTGATPASLTCSRSAART